MSEPDKIALVRPLPASMTRRSFLRGAIGAAVAAAGTTALAGCSGGSGASSDGSSFNVDVSASAGETFDTQLTSTTWGASENICEPLIKLNPETLQLEPVLLTGMPTVSDDNLTYSFELKDGVKFHDGSALTSTDVQYTLTRLLAKQAEADSFVYIQGGQDVVDGKATELSGFAIQDDRHFTITLREVFSSFLNMLAQFYANIYPHEACEAAGDDWGHGTNFIGTGPYKLTANDEQTTVTLDAFEDYHEGKPSIDRINVTYTAQADQRMMRYKSGACDLCFFDPSLLEQYRNDADVKDQIAYAATGATQFVNLNLNDDRLKDVRVRQALSLAINRQELCDTVLAGAAQPCSGFVPPSVTGYTEGNDVLPYDPDQARQLLSDTGVSNLTLDAIARDSENDVMVAIQGYWQAIGVTLNIRQVDNSTYSSERKAGNMIVGMVRWSTLSYVGCEMMASFFRSDNASTRSSNYNSPEFDGFIDASRKATDDDTALDNTRKADNQLVRVDYATIPVDWPQDPYVLRSGYSGLEILVDPHFGNLKKDA